MKKLTLVLFVFIAASSFFACRKDTTATANSAVNTPADRLSTNTVSWVNVIPATSFSSYSTYWNDLYPWGSDHNGSA
ncbi:MAG TPA: hypothetical protein VF500_03525, partial [Mucilaginibacter sp.]